MIIKKKKHFDFASLIVFLSFTITVLSTTLLDIPLLIAGILSFLVPICVARICNQHTNQKRTDKVAFGNRCNFSYFQVLNNNLNGNIVLTQEDAIHIPEIMTLFNQWIQRRFFDNTLFKIKGMDYLQEEEFIMFCLNSYLEPYVKNIHCDLQKEEIVEPCLSKKSKGRFKLTAKGVSYYKLYYLSYLYCQNNKNILLNVHLGSCNKDNMLSQIKGATFHI